MGWGKLGPPEDPGMHPMGPMPCPKRENYRQDFYLVFISSKLLQRYGGVMSFLMIK